MHKCCCFGRRVGLGGGKTANGSEVAVMLCFALAGSDCGGLYLKLSCEKRIK